MALNVPNINVDYMAAARYISNAYSAGITSVTDTIADAIAENKSQKYQHQIAVSKAEAGLSEKEKEVTLKEKEQGIGSYNQPEPKPVETQPVEPQSDLDIARLEEDGVVMENKIIAGNAISSLKSETASWWTHDENGKLKNVFQRGKLTPAQQGAFEIKVRKTAQELQDRELALSTYLKAKDTMINPNGAQYDEEYYLKAKEHYFKTRQIPEGGFLQPKARDLNEDFKKYNNNIRWRDEVVIENGKEIIRAVPDGVTDADRANKYASSYAGDALYRKAIVQKYEREPVEKQRDYMLIAEENLKASGAEYTPEDVAKDAVFIYGANEVAPNYGKPYVKKSKPIQVKQYKPEKIEADKTKVTPTPEPAATIKYINKDLRLSDVYTTQETFKITVDDNFIDADTGKAIKNPTPTTFTTERIGNTYYFAKDHYYKVGDKSYVRKKGSVVKEDDLHRFPPESITYGPVAYGTYRGGDNSEGGNASGIGSYGTSTNKTSGSALKRAIVPLDHIRPYVTASGQKGIANINVNEKIKNGMEWFKRQPKETQQAILNGLRKEGKTLEEYFKTM